MARTKAEEALVSELTGIFRREMDLLEDRLTRSIDLKHDKGVARVELQNLKDGTQRIATKAEEAIQMANQPHQCSQMGSISDITQDVRDIRHVLYGNRGLKYGAVVAIVGSLLTAAAFIFDIRTETAVTKAQVIDMQQDVVTLQKDSRQLQDTVKKNNEKSEEKANQILFNLQALDSKVSDGHVKPIKYKRRNDG